MNSLVQQLQSNDDGNDDDRYDGHDDDQTTPMCPCKRKYGYLSNAQKLRES